MANTIVVKHRSGSSGDPSGLSTGEIAANINDKLFYVGTGSGNIVFVDKTYVDNAISGGVSYKGGYDASANSPNLDDTSPVATTQGDMYTVTTAGTFFTTSVEVGDVLIAEQDSATAEANWTIVQANITYSAAQIKTLYESNSDTNAYTDAEKTKLSGIEASADVTDATNVAAAGAVMDGDFSTNGLMKRTGAGTYSIITDNSSNWNTAYNDKINSASFATGTGILTLTQQDSGTVTVDLDGRYLTSETYTGTVTSVAMTVPTGLTVSGTPITSSGTLAITLTSGYSIPTTTKQTQWDTAYSWGNHASAGYLDANSTIDGGTY